MKTHYLWLNLIFFCIAWTSQFVEEAAIVQAHRLKDSKKQVFLDWVNSV